jgi:hypothetical protein
MFCQAFSSATEFSQATHKPLLARHSACAASLVAMQNPISGESELRSVHIIQTNLFFPAVIDLRFPGNADTKMPVQ